MNGDVENLFYPRLERRETYSGAEGVKSPKYSDYRQEIEEDCKNRCVYCDVAVQEHAYEGMQLDHFRPKKYFPTLEDDPLNLVLCCPKCNRFKWHHWPCEKDASVPSHNDHVGFIEPFVEYYGEYFSVQTNGELGAIKPPADYTIRLLRLNRKARVQVRRRRIIRNKVKNIVTSLSERIQNLATACEKDEISKSDAIDEIGQLSSIIATLDHLLNVTT